MFRRGKHRGRPLAEIATLERDYLSWMLGAEDMDHDVLHTVREALGAEHPSESSHPVSTSS